MEKCHGGVLKRTKTCPLQLKLSLQLNVCGGPPLQLNFASSGEAQLYEQNK